MCGKIMGGEGGDAVGKVKMRSMLVGIEVKVAVVVAGQKIVAVLCFCAPPGGGCITSGGILYTMFVKWRFSQRLLRRDLNLGVAPLGSLVA